MAILNYAKSYGTIKDYLNLQESDSGDYVKLFFTKDGHIVTHGVDYTKDYNGGVRGLVPNYNSDLGEKGVLSNNGWVDIFSVLPINDTITISDTTHIPTNAQVALYISNTIKTAETLKFKGGIGYKNNAYYYIPVGGTETTSFPKNCKIGDSYRILTNGTTVADSIAQAGDMIICIKDTTSEGETGSEYWLTIQANIQGTSLVTINGVSYNIYTGTVIEGNKSIYAPSEKGNKGQLLVSSGGNTPNWANFNISNTGLLTLTGTETYLSTNIIANRVQKTLKAGAGITGNDFDGSTEQTWNLNIASTDLLGGILIDNNEKPTVSIDSNGRIFLDANNIYNALGYLPVNPETVGRDITINGISIGPETTLNFIPTGDIYIKADSNLDGIVDLSFGLSWYNISDNRYEYDSNVYSVNN